MSEYCKEKVEGYIPELKENEDERVRKALLESFEYQIKESRPDKEWICGVKLKEIVAINEEGVHAVVWKDGNCSIHHPDSECILSIFSKYNSRKMGKLLSTLPK